MIPLLKFASQLWLIKVGKAQRNNPLFFLKGCLKKKFIALWLQEIILYFNHDSRAERQDF